MPCIDGLRMRMGVIRTAEYFMSKEIAAFLRDHLEIHLDLNANYRQEFVTGLCWASFDFVIKGYCFIAFLPNKRLNEAKAWRWAVMNQSSKESWRGCPSLSSLHTLLQSKWKKEALNVAVNSLLRHRSVVRLQEKYYFRPASLFGNSSRKAFRTFFKSSKTPNLAWILWT